MYYLQSCDGQEGTWHDGNVPIHDATGSLFDIVKPLYGQEYNVMQP